MSTHSILWTWKGERGLDGRLFALEWEWEGGGVGVGAYSRWSLI